MSRRARWFSETNPNPETTMRHRLIPNFEAEAEGITTDHIVTQILQDVPVTGEAVNA